MERPSSTDQAGSALQRAALFGLASSLAAVLGGILRAKATALALGPDGFGTAAAVVQITSLFFVPLGLVTGPALVSALARARERGESGQTYHDTAATLVLAGGTALGVLSVGAGAFVFRNEGPHLILFTGLAAVAALMDPLTRVTNASLLARGDVRRYAIVMASTSAIVAVVAAGATAAAGLPGQFVAAAVIPFLLLLAFGPIWQRALPDLRLLPRPTLDREYLREAAAVGVATLLTGAAMQASLSAIRWALWQHGGAEANGQFQAAWTVGSAYLGIMLQGVATGVFPRYAAATLESLPAEVDAASKFVFDAAPPIILIAIAVREPAMHLLYSSEFDVAGQLAGYQIAADFARALSYVYGGVLLYRGEVRAFMVTELIGAGMFALTSVLLVGRFGAVGAAYGYAVTYALYVVLSAVVLARVAKVPVRPYALLAVLLFTAASSGAVTACIEWPWLRWPLLLIGGVWATQTGIAALVWGRLRSRLGALR